MKYSFLLLLLVLLSCDRNKYYGDYTGEHVICTHWVTSELINGDDVNICVEHRKIVDHYDSDLTLLKSDTVYTDRIHMSMWDKVKEDF